MTKKTKQIIGWTVYIILLLIFTPVIIVFLDVWLFFLLYFTWVIYLPFIGFILLSLLIVSLPFVILHQIILRKAPKSSKRISLLLFFLIVIFFGLAFPTIVKIQHENDLEENGPVPFFAPQYYLIEKQKSGDEYFYLVQEIFQDASNDRTPYNRFFKSFISVEPDDRSMLDYNIVMSDFNDLRLFNSHHQYFIPADKAHLAVGFNLSQLKEGTVEVTFQSGDKELFLLNNQEVE